MNNTDLMKLLKRINQNNLQRKYLIAMGGIILIAGVGIFFLNKKNNKTNMALQSSYQLNNSLTIQSKELQGNILKKESQIKDLTDENEALQELIKLKQNQNPV